MLIASRIKILPCLGETRSLGLPCESPLRKPAVFCV
ncbi:Uncharacterised protein [Vibrio cholerae]|nr:Uncharacterised protein [Vibrio cholerae]